MIKMKKKKEFFLSNKPDPFGPIMAANFRNGPMTI